jgi:hypothetical protein
MRLVTNRMTFDDCGCVISYAFDADDITDDTRFTLVASDQPCSAHASLASSQDHCDAVHRENDARAKLVNAAVKAVPAKLGQRNTESGEYDLHPDVGYRVHFTGTGADRGLAVEFTERSTGRPVDLAPGEKAQMRAALLLVKTKHKIDVV